MSGTLGKDSNLCVIPGGIGGGSAVKMAHQALAGKSGRAGYTQFSCPALPPGTQITLVAEVMAFAARLGLPLRSLREHLLRADSTATSGIIRTRGQNMLDGLLKPNSTVDIWLKDLGIVLDEAEAMQVPVYFSGYVLQANILASSYGWGLQDDSRWGTCCRGISGGTEATQLGLDIQCDSIVATCRYSGGTGVMATSWKAIRHSPGHTYHLIVSLFMIIGRNPLVHVPYAHYCVAELVQSFLLHCS